MENMNTWGILILLFLLFIVFGGGNSLFGNGRSCNDGCVTNCDVKTQEIIDTARTQYLQEVTARNTQDAVYLDGEKTRTKIDFYEYQNLRDQLNNERTANVFLKGQMADIERFNHLNNKIDEIACSLPKRPPFYSQGYVPTGCPVPCDTTV